MKQKRTYASRILRKTVLTFRSSEDASLWLVSAGLRVFRGDLEFAVPTAIIVDSVASKLASVIKYQLPLGQSHQNLSTSRSITACCFNIDLCELSTSQHHPGCVIPDYTDFDVSAISFMPVDMSSRPAVLSFINNPLPSLLFF